MSRNACKCAVVVLCGVVALAGLSASGSQGDKAKPSGVWMLVGGDVKIDFSDKEVMKIYPHGDNEVIVIVCKYTPGKDRQVKAKITGFEGKDDAKKQIQNTLPVGLEFSFTWDAKDAAATRGDIKGKNLPDHMKSHLEGKYESK